MSNLEKDARELVSKMTIEEVASQLKYDAPAIERLGIPEYNWWNEVLHGVARAGVATVFPQAIGLAAMFDDEELMKIATIISEEARAKYNAQFAEDDHDIYKGLTVWSPNINLFRDPRWGRGHETYGEDPYLTSRLGVAFIKGLQGTENYPECDTLKTAACAKHFAVHSGPEGERHHFDAKATAKDMEETYLPAFEAAVREAKVESVMGAYNRTNGEPCCASKTLMKDILRGKWGFGGHYVSDCWAIRDIHENHKVTNSPSESASMALKAGCDLNCGVTYLCLLAALKEKRITEEELREACVRLMKTRMKLGIIERSEEDAKAKTAVYDGIGFLQNDTEEHRKASLNAARKSLVLLKNNGVLPLSGKDYPVIGVIGPTANLRTVLEGNYCGTASRYVTNLEGIQNAAESRVIYSEGSHLYKDSISNLVKYPDDRMSEAVSVVKNSDLVILCVGLDATLEGEEGDTGNMFASGDKIDLQLPACQRRLCEKVIAAAKEKGINVIAVNNSGSAIDLSFLHENADAVLQCWYSGEEGGTALADVLFGKVNPSGKLPLTFYKDGDLPEFTDYSLKNRTYRYYKGDVLYPFGYGLSYTTFDTDFEIERTDENTPVFDSNDYDASLREIVTAKVTVKNSGSMDGDEVILLYADKMPEDKLTRAENASCKDRLLPEDQPLKSLVAFKRVSLKARESMDVSLPVSLRSLTTVLEDGERVFLSGDYTFSIGNAQRKITIS